MSTEARRSLINGYLSTGIDDVKGWCIPQLWQSIWPLAQRIGDGPVAEIGVFEGKAEALSRSKNLTYLVPNLVEAMFTNFPGNSGERVRISVAPE